MLVDPKYTQSNNKNNKLLVKAEQNGLADFNYYLLQKVNRLIKCH